MLYSSIIAGQARSQGERAVEAIMALRKTLEIHDQTIRSLEGQLLADIHHTINTDDIPQQLLDVQSSRVRITKSLSHKYNALGVDECKILANAARSSYFRLQMNARALKRRIRDRLRQRKFELERLERAYRQTVTGQL